MSSLAIQKNDPLAILIDDFSKDIINKVIQLNSKSRSFIALCQYENPDICRTQLQQLQGQSTSNPIITEKTVFSIDKQPREGFANPSQSKPRKKIDDDDAPIKKPRSAYNFYVKCESIKIKQQNPHMRAPDIVRVAAERYNNMTEQQKRPYVQQFQQAKRQYQEQQNDLSGKLSTGGFKRGRGRGTRFDYTICDQICKYNIYYLMNIEQFAFILMGIIIMIILYIFLGKYLEHRHWHFLHETGIGILIGLLFGVLASLGSFIHEISFNEELFFYGLLPPMIFAGGYNLKKQDFGKNIKYILLFGVLGTITAFGVIFGLTYLINQAGLIIPVKEGLDHEHFQTGLIVKYSATISATDSVAALTLIDSSQFPKLFSIIFGQGMVNDAVAIILFKVVGGIFDKMGSDPMDGGEIAGQIIGNFVLTIVASLGIGLATAFICSLTFKHGRFLVKSEITQVVITYLFGILSYVIAQLLDMSGVITVLVSGVALAHYNFYNLSPGGMHATSVFFQFISFIAEAVVFIYLGISVVFYFQNQVFSLSFLGLQLLVCFLSRAVSIFVISLIFKFITKKWTVSFKELSVVSIAGSIRGSVAFALILTIEADEHEQHLFNQVSIVKSTTLVMVVLTTIILGGLMPKFIKLFLGQKKSNQQQNKPQILAQNIVRKKEKKQKKGFAAFYQFKFKPFFIYQYAQKKAYYKQLKRAMKINSKGQSNNQAFDNLVRASVIQDFKKSKTSHSGSIKQ